MAVFSQQITIILVLLTLKLGASADNRVFDQPIDQSGDLSAFIASDYALGQGRVILCNVGTNGDVARQLLVYGYCDAMAGVDPRRQLKYLGEALNMTPGGKKIALEVSSREAWSVCRGIASESSRIIFVYPEEWNYKANRTANNEGFGLARLHWIFKFVMGLLLELFPMLKLLNAGYKEIQNLFYK